MRAFDTKVRIFVYLCIVPLQQKELKVQIKN